MKEYIGNENSEFEITLPNGMTIRSKQEIKLSSEEMQKLGFSYLEANARFVDYLHSLDISEYFGELATIYNKTIDLAYQMGKNNYPRTIIGEDSFNFVQPEKII